LGLPTEEIPLPYSMEVYGLPGLILQAEEDTEKMFWSNFKSIEYPISQVFVNKPIEKRNKKIRDYIMQWIILIELLEKLRAKIPREIVSLTRNAK
jgi:hypothetical protein